VHYWNNEQEAGFHLTHNNNVHGHFVEYDGPDHYILRPTSNRGRIGIFRSRHRYTCARIALIGIEIPVWFLGDPSVIETRRLRPGRMSGWSLTPGSLTGGRAFT
jgi:hypothetical protein